MAAQAGRRRGRCSTASRRASCARRSSCPSLLLDSRPDRVQFSGCSSGALKNRRQRLADRPGMRWIRRCRIGSGLLRHRRVEAEAREIMDAAWELGITLFDTADAYGGGRSGERHRHVASLEGAFGSRPHRPYDGRSFTRGRPRDRGLSRARIVRQIEGSLSRLGVERVELYMTHGPIPIRRFRRPWARSSPWSEQARSPRSAPATSGHRSLRVPAGLSRVGAELLLASDRKRRPTSFPSARALGSASPVQPAGGWLADGEVRRGHEAPPGSRMALRPRATGASRRGNLSRDRSLLRGSPGGWGRSPRRWRSHGFWHTAQVDAVIVGPRRRSNRPGPARAGLALSPAERDELAAAMMPRLDHD